MIMPADNSDWRSVLAATQAYNLSRSGTFDLRPFWRTLAFRQYAGQPQPVIRAQAFANVLDHVDLHTYGRELVVGSRAGFAVDALPDGVSQADYQAAVAQHDARGQRDFQAGWDHTLADYPTLLAEGIKGLLGRIAESRQVHTSADQQAVLDGMQIAVDALGRFILRHAAQTADAELAGRLKWIAGNQPRTFHEAVQLVWLTHIAFVSEGRYANALGRIDQYLLPFYNRDIAAGRLDRRLTLDILCHLWAHVEELGEVTNICVGGQKPDGSDGTNELSYLCIEATRLVQSPHTNLSARFHDGSPDAFHQATFECIRTGVGFPAIFNDHVLIPGLVEAGIPIEVARDHCMAGCIETMLAGRQQAWSDSRFNTPLCLLSALDRLAGETAPSWERLQTLFAEEVRSALAVHTAGINAHIGSFPPEKFPDPFLSALTRDCIGRARDINDGGAEFSRFHGIAIMGLATIADSLAAVKKLVIEDKAVSLQALLAAIKTDFAGQEPLRQMLMNKAPKYGNADPYVDDIAAWVVQLTANTCLEHRTIDGGKFIAAMAANVSNIPAGKEVGATPDGRHAGVPLSDAASPYFGRDMQGPTAFLRSVARPDYRRVLTGSVINMKFEPDFFQGLSGVARFGAITRFFVRSRIPELQFNFTGTRTLLDAREHPENHGSLVVRVSGFSAYFTRLSSEVQDDIIRRRGHGAPSDGQVPC
jgi:pyruvate-formate lyase